MQFSLDKSIEILERTPLVLKTLLSGLSEDWVLHNEGNNTWSPFDVVGHLIHGEKTDWIPRMQIILQHGQNRAFDPFDRFAQFEESKGKTLEQLLEEFTQLRKKSIAVLKKAKLGDDSVQKTGTHPELGRVILKQLIATWTVHDLGHIVQISRVMAKQYKDEVGPWTAYLTVLK